MAVEKKKQRRKRDDERKGQIVGINVSGDGLSPASAELQVRFLEFGKNPESLHVRALAPQMFGAICSMALYAYMSSAPVWVISRDDRLISLRLENLTLHRGHRA